MELDIQFETKVTLTAKDMGKDITNLDELLEKKKTAKATTAAFQRRNP